MHWLNRFALSACMAGLCTTIWSQELPAVRTPHRPMIDGRLDDACWGKTPVATDFSVLGSGGEERAFRQTAVRVVWDDRALYLAAVCLEPLPATLSAKAVKRDGATWMDDALELFLQPRPASGPLFHFIVNYKGVLFDQKNGGSSFNVSTTPVTTVGKQEWTLEFEISWTDLGMAPPKTGTSFGFNVGREHRPHDPEWSTWAPLEKKTHRFSLPKNFGSLKFVESAEVVRVSRLAVPGALVRNAGFAQRDAGGKPVGWSLSSRSRLVEITPGSTQFALRNDTDYGLGSQKFNLTVRKGEVYTIFAVIRGGGGAQAGVAAVQTMTDGRPDDLYPFWNMSITEDFRLYTGRVFTDEGVEKIDRIIPYRSNKRGWVEFAYLQMVPGIRGVSGIDDISHCTRPDERGLGEPAPTPALPCFKPLPGGSLKALVFIGQYQRDVAELAQRLDLDYDLVYCPPCRGSSKVESAIAEDSARMMRTLTTHRYDLVILAGRPSEQSTIDGIAESVRQGTGLLVVEPLVASSPAKPEIYTQLSILFPAADGTTLPAEIAGALSADALLASSKNWQPVKSLTTAALGKGRVVRLTWSEKVPGLIPFRTGTGEYWEYRWALVAKAALWAADRLPQGQIKALSPTAATIANPANESLRLHAAWDTPDGLVGAFEHEIAPGSNVTVPIPDAGNLRFARGPILLRARLLNAKGEALDIASTPLPGTSPRIRLAMLTLPTTASPGDLVSGSFQCQADAGAKPRLVIALTDAFGRVVDLQTLRPGTGKSAHEFTLSVRTPLSVFHRLSVTAYDEVDGGESVVAALLEKPLLVPAAARGHLDDFQLGAGYAVMHILCQPYLLDSFVAFLRKYGVTACTVNRTLIERGMPAWGGTLSGGGMAHKADDSTRPNCFSDPKELAGLCQRTVANARKRQAWGYLGYNMHDEVHLHQLGKVETCDSAACVAAFRAWAQSCYGTIAEANAEWDTDHADFAAVGMPRIENMKEGQNPAQWIDYRLFMERVWANAYAQAHAAVRKAYPNVNMSFTNPYRYNALSGTNFELWTPNEEVMLRYFHRHVADRCRSWSDAPMLAWIGYRTRTESLRKFMWEFAFQGGAMPIWWDPILPWAYSGKRGFTPWYMFGPLWRETERSQAVSAPALELERGLGRVLRTATSVPADVVILHSQASMHLTYVRAALAEGQITNKGTKVYRASDEAMAQAIQRQSFPYRYARVTTLEEDLADAKVVALPLCRALDDATVATLKRFVERGGRLLADTMPATHTGHGRPRASSPLASLFDGKRGFCLGKPADSASQDELIAALASLTPLPKIAVRTPQGAPPTRMRLFRYRLGSAEVVGIVQGVGDDAEPVLTLQLPDDERQVYDMRRGVPLGKTGASQSLKLIQGDAAIFALLPYRPGALTATVKANARMLEIRAQLADTPTGAVHIFRIDIMRPGDPAPCHWYSRNVVASAGAAAFDIPLAHNDPAGTWQVRIRDQLTGAKTSCAVTVSAKTLQ